MLLTIIIFIAVLLILILSHEAGHFFTARFFGIKVEEFGFGIPPRIGGIKRGETLYSFNLLPFGGFVKIFGEEGGERGNQRSFGNKSALVKSAVLLSGVMANIFLAFLIFSAASNFGAIRALSQKEALLFGDARITIVDVISGSPANFAGIKFGDKIKTINGSIPNSLEAMQGIIQENKGKNIEIIIERNDESLTKNITPRVSFPKDEGPLGVALSWTRVEKIAWYRAPWEGAKITWNTFLGTVVGFYNTIKNLIFGQTQNIQISGPVGIFNLTRDVQRSGFAMLLMFVGILSINLAIINVLPFPGLDGGRFLFVVLEAIRRKPISSKISSIFHGIGLAILIALMIAITIRDVSKIF